MGRHCCARKQQYLLLLPFRSYLKYIFHPASMKGTINGVNGVVTSLPLPSFIHSLASQPAANAPATFTITTTITTAAATRHTKQEALTYSALRNAERDWHNH